MTLHAYIREGRLIRHAWTGTDAQGRETACLLAAQSTEVRRAQRSDACPAHVLPWWFADLTVWVNDAPSDEAWPAIVRRYADLAARWHALNATAWDRARVRVLAVLVRGAARGTGDTHVVAACQTVADLCDRQVRGDRPSNGEWLAAERAADAYTVFHHVERTVERERAARATRTAARVAVHAARLSQPAVPAARLSQLAAAATQSTRATDRICHAVLDAIEAEIAATI